MIKSNYISDLVNLLLDGNDDASIFKPQVEFLSELRREYTLMGLFVYFNHENEILKYAVTEYKNVITGVKIYSTTYHLEGEVNLFVKDGKLDYLEIVYYQESFPKADLDKYTLKQAWKNSPEKQISTESNTSI